MGGRRDADSFPVSFSLNEAADSLRLDRGTSTCTSSSSFQESPSLSLSSKRLSDENRSINFLSKFWPILESSDSMSSKLLFFCWFHPFRFLLSFGGFKFDLVLMSLRLRPDC